MAEAIACLEHPAFTLGSLFFFVFTQVDGEEHKVERAERKGQKLNRYHRARVEQRGVDVGGIVKDVIDERQDEQNLELGRAFDRQTGSNVTGPMQQDRKDGDRGDNAAPRSTRFASQWRRARRCPSSC